MNVVKVLGWAIMAIYGSLILVALPSFSYGIDHAVFGLLLIAAFGVTARVGYWMTKGKNVLGQGVSES